MIFISGHGSRLASRGNTWAHPQTLFFSFLTLTFYPSISFGLPSIHLRTFPSCWNVLSDPLLSSCTSLRSTLVLFRLGLPATEINLAYLYKALAFAHLYVPQSCYHKSHCLSSSGRTTSTSAILTFALLHYSTHHCIACRNLFIHENRYITTTIHISTNLVKGQLSPPTSFTLIHSLKTTTFYIRCSTIGSKGHPEFTTESNRHHSLTPFRFKSNLYPIFETTSNSIDFDFERL